MSIQNLSLTLTQQKSSPNNPEFDTEIYRSLEVSFGKIKELLANYIRVTNELVENSDVSNVTANDSKQQTCAKLNGTILAGSFSFFLILF